MSKITICDAKIGSKDNCVISIDVGNEASGLTVIASGEILEALNTPNGNIFDKVRKYYVKWPITVVLEDIRPYSGKLSMQVIDTCKFIGEAVYRLRNEIKAPVVLITRQKVRKWVFDQFTDLCVERIDKKIAYLDDYGEKNDKRRYRNKDGDLRKASFHYVDDRVVIAAMKKLWKIPEPKPFKGNIYGLKEHSWQALALGSYYISKLQEPTPDC